MIRYIYAKFKRIIHVYIVNIAHECTIELYLKYNSYKNEFQNPKWMF